MTAMQLCLRLPSQTRLREARLWMNLVVRPLQMLATARTAAYSQRGGYSQGRRSG